MACSGCTCRAIQSANSVESPCCRGHTLSSETVRSPSSLFMSLVNDLVVLCGLGCGGAVRVQDYKEHSDSKCRSFRGNLYSPSKVTLKDVMDKPSTSPATPVEVRAAHSLVKRLLNQGEGCSSSSPPVIKLGSGRGQVCEYTNFFITKYEYCVFKKPIILVQVPAGRVGSSGACAKTVLNRTKALSTVREVASCGDSMSQLGAEVKALSKVDRQNCPSLFQ